MSKAILMRLLVAALCTLLPLGTMTAAESRETLGVGRLFTNDSLGDGRDRYQSGSYVRSYVRGPADWDGTPEEFGTLLEYRLRSSVITSDGFGPAPGDRPYVGTLSFGVHSHFGEDTIRGSLGFDVTAIGPQTGVSDFQDNLHDLVDFRRVPFSDSQLDNNVLFGLTAEVAEILRMNDRFTARPFAEFLIGPESLGRIGADVFFGSDVVADLLLRDVTTGQLYRGTEGEAGRGFAFVLGADMAVVTDSNYLPADRNVEASGVRGRARAGVHWQGESDSSVFYGLTYLSPEFDDQPEGQFTGSLKLNFNF